VWNVYFSQSQNALNTGANFKTVQISDHPNHIGPICNGGLGCPSGGRNLLDFFTLDIDHLGAATTVWTDDNNAFTSPRDKLSRQLAGNSVFKSTPIALQSSWPITDHAVSDPAGDVFDGAGFPRGSCPGMDLLGTSEQQSSGNITITLTLNAAPTKANAIACSAPDTPATGGLWGAEFWGSAAQGNDNFYIAYRDDGTSLPGVEGGTVEALNATVTSLEFRPTTVGTLGGNCLPPGSGTMPANGTCTISMTVPASSLGIKAGAGLYSITGLSTYMFLGVNKTTGALIKPNLLAFEGGNSEQADAATAFDDNGTGTTK
jgi:hypothetical protein